MRLSEAILLGDSLKKGSNDYWIDDEYECGCAFGGALVATGMTYVEFNESWRRLQLLKPSVSAYDIFVIAEMDCILSRWPWITREHLKTITKLYQLVLDGKGTIEQVADYARSVEPEEIKLTETAEPQAEAVTV
jgi:hypothetical protein